MDFICITNLNVRTKSQELTRKHKIHEIQFDFLKVIETPTAIPFSLFNKFKMCGVEFVVVDIDSQIEINTNLNRVEHITTILLAYEEEKNLVEDYVPF